jgi:ATP-dependent helicase/DNAse subunit B
MDELITRLQSLNDDPHVAEIVKAALRVDQEVLCIRVHLEQHMTLLISVEQTAVRFLQNDFSQGRVDSTEVNPREFLIRYGRNNAEELEKVWQSINRQLEEKAKWLLEPRSNS